MNKLLLVLSLFLLLVSCDGYQMVSFNTGYRPTPVVRYNYNPYYTSYYTNPPVVHYYNVPHYYPQPRYGGGYHHGGGRR
jgi:hypothetical protein